MKRKISLLLFVALIVFCGCGEKAPPPAPPPPGVVVAHPGRQVITEFIEATGNTQPADTVQLVARVAGYLERVYFKDGQVVKKGDPLFLIQPNTYRDNLRQAEAQILLYKSQIEYAAIQLARFSNLLSQNAAAQSDVDNWRYQRDSAKANMLAARAQRDLARLNLSYTLVRAPFNGRIDRRLVDTGNLVGSGANTVVAQISRIDPINVYFNISDLDLARLMKVTGAIPGQGAAAKWPIFAGLAPGDDYPLKGTLDFASISVTPTTGTLLMRGIVPNEQGKIIPGLYARVRVPVEKRPVFLVPEATVGNDQQGAFVLIVNEKNTVERRNVRTGPLVDNNMRAVYEGLGGQEWVITKGTLKARPGAQVTPQHESVSADQQPASTREAPQPAGQQGLLQTGQMQMSNQLKAGP